VSPSFIEESLRITLEMLGQPLMERLRVPPRGKTWLHESTCRRLRTETAVMADCVSALVIYLSIRIALLSHDGSSINGLNIQTSNVQVEVKLNAKGNLVHYDAPDGTLNALLDLMVKAISHLTAKDSQTGADHIIDIFDTQLADLLNTWHDIHFKMFKKRSSIVPKLEPDYSFLAKAGGGAEISDNANAATKQSDILGEYIYEAATTRLELDSTLSSEEKEERRKALLPITLACAGHTACCSLDSGSRELKKLLEELLGEDLVLFSTTERASADVLALARATHKLLNFFEQNMYEKGYQRLFKHELEKEYPNRAVVMRARLTKGGRQYDLVDASLEQFYNRYLVVWFLSKKRETKAGADNKLNHNVLFHSESLPIQSAYQALTVLKDKVYDALRFASNDKELAEKEKWSPLHMGGVSATTRQYHLRGHPRIPPPPRPPQPPLLPPRHHHHHHHRPGVEGLHRRHEARVHGRGRRDVLPARLRPIRERARQHLGVQEVEEDHRRREYYEHGRQVADPIPS